MAMQQCSSCRGFVPEGVAACPNCHRRSGFTRRCLELAAGCTVAVTMMACYGGPPQAYQPEPTTPQQPASCQDSEDTPGSAQDQNCEKPLVPENQEPASGDFAQPPPGS